MAPSTRLPAMSSTGASLTSAWDSAPAGTVTGGSVAGVAAGSCGSLLAAATGVPPLLPERNSSHAPDFFSRRSTRSVGSAPWRSHLRTFSLSISTTASGSAVERPRGRVDAEDLDEPAVAR